MNLRRIDLNLFTVFDAIMIECNLSRAAEKIGMSQSAMSHALSRLRVMLDDELFVSTGRGVRPTQRARELAGPTRKMLDLAVGLISYPTEFDCRSSNHEFNLILGDYGEVVLTGRIMELLRENEATVKINLKSKFGVDFKEALHFGVVDICFVPMPIEDHELNSQKVIDETYCTLVRREHPDVGDTLTLEQFVNLDHVVVEWPEQHRHIESALHEKGLTRRHSMHVQSITCMPRIVANSNMICTLPSNMARAFAEEFGLKMLPTPLAGVNLPAYLLWHTSMDNDPGHTWLRTFLFDIFRRIQP